MNRNYLLISIICVIIILIYFMFVFKTKKYHRRKRIHSETNNNYWFGANASGINRGYGREYGGDLDPEEIY